MLCHSKAAPLGTGRALQMSRCWQAGFCICKLRLRQQRRRGLDSLVLAFQNALRRLLAKGAWARRFYDTGSLVIALRRGDEGDQGQVSLWWHLGYGNLQTAVFCGLPLFPAAERQEEAAAMGLVALELRGHLLDNVQNMWTAMSLLDSEVGVEAHGWQVDAYALHAGTLAVSELRPGKQLLVEHPEPPVTVPLYEAPRIALPVRRPAAGAAGPAGHAVVAAAARVVGPAGHAVVVPAAAARAAGPAGHALAPAALVPAPPPLPWGDSSGDEEACAAPAGEQELDTESGGSDDDMEPPGAGELLEAFLDPDPAWVESDGDDFQDHQAWGPDIDSGSEDGRPHAPDPWDAGRPPAVSPPENTDAQAASSRSSTARPPNTAGRPAENIPAGRPAEDIPAGRLAEEIPAGRPAEEIPAGRPAEQSASAPGRPGDRRVAPRVNVNPVYEVPPGPGTLVFNMVASSLDAHCRQPGHGDGCRLNRTVKAGRKANGSQGRPVGLLMAWLEDAANHPTRAAHLAAARAAAPVPEAYTREARQLARDRCKAIFAEGTGPLARERPKRPDELSEPEGLV